MDDADNVEELMDWVNRETNKEGNMIGDKGLKQMMSDTVEWWKSQGYVKKVFQSTSAVQEEKKEDVAATVATAVSSALLKTLDAVDARLAALGVVGGSFPESEGQEVPCRDRCRGRSPGRTSSGGGGCYYYHNYHDGCCCCGCGRDRSTGGGWHLIERSPKPVYGR